MKIKTERVESDRTVSRPTPTIALNKTEEAVERRKRRLKEKTVPIAQSLNLYLQLSKGHGQNNNKKMKNNRSRGKRAGNKNGKVQTCSGLT